MMQTLRSSPELDADARLKLNQPKLNQLKKFERESKPGTRTEAKD
jgi:hypothetical protein